SGRTRGIGEVDGVPTERQQEAIDRQEQLVERLREQARLAEHLAGERHYEDIANGMGLMQHAGEAAAGVMERLGLVTRNAAGGFGEMAEASAELVDPLTEQVEQLQEMLIELTAGEDALLNYHQAQALAAAAQEDAANGTTRNTEAVMRHFEALRTLRAQIADARASQEQATQADLANAQARQEQAQQARNLAGTYRELMSTVNPLAAQQAKLNEQLASMTQLASLGVDELEALGVDAELLGEIIQALADELDGLGRASDVDTFFGLD